MNGVELITIGQTLFRGFGLTSIVIPNTVKNIHWAAFHKNNLKQVELPESIVQIWSDAFSGNPLESVTIKNKKENVTLGSQAFGSFDTNNIVWDYTE